MLKLFFPVSEFAGEGIPLLSELRNLLLARGMGSCKPGVFGFKSSEFCGEKGFCALGSCKV